MKKNKTICLIDGSGFIFRAYYALPALSNNKGVPVGAVLGFCNMLFKTLEDDNNEKVVVVFDTARTTFRNKIYPLYKSNRGAPPEDLVPQFGLIRKAVDAFNITRIEMEGYEADDLIATYAKHFSEKSWCVNIISSDKDLMQLVSETIKMTDPIKNKIIGKEEVFNKFGVYPDKVIDVQSLAGDSTDNVPGAPGIGIKTASMLINEFGSLERLLTNYQNIKQNKRRESIEKNIDNIKLSKELVTLKQDIDIEIQFEKISDSSIDEKKLLPFLEEHSFHNLKNRIYNKSEIHEKSKILSPKISYNLINKEEDLEKILDEIIEHGCFAIDTETDSLKSIQANLIGISLSYKLQEAYYIPIAHISATAIEQLDKNTVIKKLNPLLENRSILKIGQNLKYDILVLKSNGFSEIKSYDDTMLMSYTLYAGLHNHNLDYLAQKYLSIEKKKYKELVGSGKKEITFSEVEISLATFYACEDAAVTLQLWQFLQKELISKKLMFVYKNIEVPLIQVISDMEINGISVDQLRLKEISSDFQKQLELLQQKIFIVTGTNFNINSPKQLSDILFEKIKLPPPKKNKSGGFSTSSEVLEDLAAEGHKIADLVIKWREITKLKSTYTDGLLSNINIKTKRIHTTFQMAGAQTGRLSSTDPNLQNIPIKTENGKKIRKTFISNVGHQLVCFDYSQIELRLLAEIADIKSLKKAFMEKQDIHKLTASQILKIPIEKISNNQRRDAKAINFGIIYGLSPFGLAKQIGVTRTVAKEYIEGYFLQYPGIKDYMERMKEFLNGHGYVETLFGRRINISNFRDRNPMIRNYSERQAINAPIQGTAADIMKRAMIKYYENKNIAILKETKLLLQVHDELVFEVPIGDMEEIKKYIVKIMEEAHLPILNLTVPLIVSVGSGNNWDEAH